MRAPLVSVVIPAFNEERLLPLCLSSLTNQTFKKPYEIIVVDNSSFDKTAEIAKSFGVKVVFEPKKGIGRARRTGFAKASGEIFVSTDADTIVPSVWLSEIYNYFQNNEEVLTITGPYTLFEGHPLTRFLSYFVPDLIVRFLRFFQGFYSLTGFNCAFRKSAYQKAGGYDENFNLFEDFDLGRKISLIGRIDFVPKIKVLTSGRRFNKGVIRGILNYLPGYFSALLGKTPSGFLPDVREEFRENRVALAANFVWILAFFFLLFTLRLYLFPNEEVLANILPVVKKTEKKIVDLTEDLKALKSSLKITPEALRP